VHGAALGRRQRAAIDQLQRRVKLVGEIFRPPAVIGECCDRGEHVLIAALAAETRLHAPDGDERPGRHAVALPNGFEHCRLRLLQRAAARDDGGSAALGEKLIERERKTPLTAIGRDRRARVIRRHQSRDARSADALGSRLTGELLFPRFKTARPAAALRGVGVRGEACERGEERESGCCEFDCLGHLKKSLGLWR
jgi:hypothetical protein